MTDSLPLLVTVHGSRLYGLAHEDSDWDVYRVVPSWNRARKNDVTHKIKGKADVTTVGLSTWLHWCEEGVPQALEAMFSTFATTDVLKDYRRSYKVNPDKMRRTYKRTAKNFMMSNEPKKQRHALRLLENLLVALETGRFDPTLTNHQRLAIATIEDLGWMQNNYDWYVRQL